MYKDKKPWEEDWAQPSQGVSVSPPDPRLPYQVEQDRGQASAAPFAAPKAAAELTRTQQQIQSQPLQNDQTRASIEGTRNSIQNSTIDNEAKLRTEFNGLSTVHEFKSALPKFVAATHAADNPVGDMQVITAWVKTYDPTGAVMTGDIQTAEQAQSAFEKLKGQSAALFDSRGRLIPEVRNNFLQETHTRLQAMADAYRQERQNYEHIAGRTPGVNPSNVIGEPFQGAFQKDESAYLGRRVRAPGEHMDATQRQVIAPQAQEQMSDGTTKAQADPMREAMNRRLGGMVSQGVGDGKIRDYAAKIGVDPASLDAALQFRRTPGFAKWKRANPNTAYPITDPALNVPTTGFERTVAETAASPLGSGLAHSANAMLAGNLPTLIGASGGDADRARLNMHAMADANPKASLAGDIAGTVGAYAAGNGMIGRVGASAAGKYIPQFIKEAPDAYHALSGRAVLGDAAYGAANGYGSTGDAMGALEGGAVGVVGGVAGRQIPRTVGSMISPAGGKAAQLYDMGVRPSPGQRAGGILNNVEQRMQDVPVFGDFIRGTRQRARDQFEHGVYNDALKEIGEQLPKGTKLGTHAQAYMQGAFNKAYDKARSAMTFVADDDFNQGVSQLLAHAKSGGLDPASAKRLESVYKNMIERRAKGGVASGNTYKVMSSQVGKVAAGATDQEFKAAARDLGSLLDQAARRHSPAEAVAAMDAADAGYAKAVRIEDAARRRGTDTGRFTPNQYDAAVQNMASGVRSRDYLAGRALNTDVAASGKMLSDTISDSGTPQRMLNAMGMSAIAGGAAYTHPATLGVLGTVGAAYAPGMRNLTTAAMAPRSSEVLRKGGAFFRGRRVTRRGGLGGVGAADWLNGDQ
jgi:hypothetical protein